MKSIIKAVFILLVVASSATSSFASIYPTITLVENTTVSVRLNDWSQQNVSITIRDTYGTILHMDKLAVEDMDVRRYNLKYLPKGNYELVIENDMKKAIHSLTVDKGTIIISQKNLVVFKPVMDLKGDYIDFNQLALGRAISISISDDSGVFFTKDFESTNTINSRFDVSKLPSGSYTLSVQGENQYDIFTFNK